MNPRLMARTSLSPECIGSRLEFGDRMMRIPQLMKTALFVAVLLVAASPLNAQDDETPAKTAGAGKTAEKTEKAPPSESATQGSISVGGQTIAYTAVAGTITVGATDVQDAQLGSDGTPAAGSELAISAPKEAKD